MLTGKPHIVGARPPRLKLPPVTFYSLVVRRARGSVSWAADVETTFACMQHRKQVLSEQAKRFWTTASQHRLMSASTDDPLIREARRVVADAHAILTEPHEILECFRRLNRE